ncbi:MAG: lycopene cyclase domain-containing protein [Alphaproteobacteria bacterium]
MTYARFLAIFLLPPLALAIALEGRRLAARHFLLLAALTAVVLAWTSPWDNLAVAMGFWGFDPARTSGLWIGWLPIEEYTFFLLQTWVAALFVIRRLRGSAGR